MRFSSQDDQRQMAGVIFVVAWNECKSCETASMASASFLCRSEAQLHAHKFRPVDPVILEEPAELPAIHAVTDQQFVSRCCPRMRFRGVAEHAFVPGHFRTTIEENRRRPRSSRRQ